VARKSVVSQLIYSSMVHGVAVLRWPEEAEQRAAFDRAGTPRLLLVDAGVEAPAIESCIEDWLRLPANDADACARLSTLAHRSSRHCSPPVVDEHGTFVFRDRSVFLSPLEHRLAAQLVDRFGEAIAEPELVDGTWDERPTDEVVRVHISRLRRRIAPLGLAVVCVRNFGYAMRVSRDATEST
jgi:hypothetical protein